jgi:signal peptidase II
VQALRKYIMLLGVASGVIGLDQWTKYLVRSQLEYGQVWTPFARLPFLRIVHWSNTGSAFGFFQSGGLVITVVAVVVSVAILFYFPRVPRRQLPLRIALSLQMGGAIGNLIDRLALGTVTDFVAVGGFPVFNVADSSITVGVAILLIALLFEDRAVDRDQAEPAAMGNPDRQQEAEHDLG